MKKLLLFSVLLFSACCFVVADDLIKPFEARAESVEIPDFCGQNEKEIEIPEWARGEIVYKHDADAPTGRIIAQSPRAGSRRRLTGEACEIHLTVSLGREHVTLPEAVGRDAREVQAELRTLGLSVETSEIPGAYADGLVLSMQPRSGSTVPIGSTVQLEISVGIAEKSAEVPSLIGMTRAEALVQIWLAELSVGEIREEPSALPEGQVVRQSHSPGTLVPAGTKIHLYISRSEEIT